ncbi:MAG: SRPBCC domain-containing protein [Actinomycetota bacterium]
MDRIDRQVDLPASPDEVWEALIGPERLSAWFGARARLEPRVGTPVEFRWEDGRQRGGVIEEADRPRRLSFRWLPFERLPGGGHRATGTGRVAFELEPTDTGTRLRVTEWGSGSGPEDRTAGEELSRAGR